MKSYKKGWMLYLQGKRTVYRNFDEKRQINFLGNCRHCLLFEGVMPAHTSQTELAKEGIRHLISSLISWQSFVTIRNPSLS